MAETPFKWNLPTNVDPEEKKKVEEVSEDTSVIQKPREPVVNPLIAQGDALFSEEDQELSPEAQAPSAVSYEQGIIEYGDSLFKEPKETEGIAVPEGIPSAGNIDVPESTLPMPIEPEYDMIEDIKSAPTSFTRGTLQGLAWTFDLPSTVVASGVEWIDDTLLGDTMNFDEFKGTFQGMLNERYGTVDSRYAGPVSEISGDVGQAVGPVVTMGVGMARYGLNQMLTQARVNPMLAPYVLNLENQLGADAIATVAGEVVEEVVEEFAEEDSLWGLAANVVTSIWSGAKLSQNMKVKGQEATGLVGDAALKAEADVLGVSVKAKPKPTAEITTEGMRGQIAESVADISNKITRPVTTLKEGAKKGVDKLVSASIWALDNMPISKTVFKAMGADNTTSFAAYKREAQALGKSGMKFYREVWDGFSEAQKKQYYANRELAAHLGLDLTVYEMSNSPKLRAAATAVAKVTPDTTMRRYDKNLEILNKYLDEMDLKGNQRLTDRVKEGLKFYNSSLKATIEATKEGIEESRAAFVKEQLVSTDPVKLADEFKSAWEDYDKVFRKLHSRQFEEAVDTSVTFTSKKLSDNFTRDLKAIKDNNLLPPDRKIPKLLRDVDMFLQGEKLPSGVVKLPKATVGDLLELRTSITKSIENLNVNSPTFREERNSLFSAVNSIEDTLSTLTTKDQKEALKIARSRWKTNIAQKRTKETSKFTTKDSFGNFLYTGENMIRDILSKSSDSATVVDRISKLTKLSFDELAEMQDKITVKELEQLSDANIAMKFKVKNYVVNDIYRQIAKNPKRPVQEIVDDYSNMHGQALLKVLDEPIEFGLFVRQVKQAESDLQKVYESKIASQLNLKGDDAGNFSMKQYVRNTLLENSSEIKRLNSLLNDPKKMQQLGLVGQDVRDVVGQTIVSEHLRLDSKGLIESSTVFKLLNEQDVNLAGLLGEDKVNHLRKFQDGYDSVTSLSRSSLTAPGTSLEVNAAESLGLGFVPRFVSDRLAIAKNRVSKHHIIALRAIQTLGGMSSRSYRDFMVKTMTDPEFFEQVVTMSNKVKTHDDIVRLRLSLAHVGVDLSIKDNEEANQQMHNLKMVSDSVEESGYTDDDLVFPFVEEEIQEPITRDEAAFLKSGGKLTEDDVTVMDKRGVIEDPEETEGPTDTPREVPTDRELTEDLNNLSAEERKALVIQRAKETTQGTEDLDDIKERIKTLSAEERVALLEIIGDSKDGDKR